MRLATLSVVLLALAGSSHAQNECVLVAGLDNHPNGNGYYEQDDNLEDCDSDGFNRYKHISQNYYMWGKSNNAGNGIWVVSETNCIRTTFLMKTGLNAAIQPSSVLDHSVTWSQSIADQSSIDSTAGNPTVSATTEALTLSTLDNHLDANGAYNTDSTLEDCGSDGFNRYKHATQDYYLWAETFNSNGQWVAQWCLTETVCDKTTYLACTVESTAIFNPSVLDLDSTITWDVTLTDMTTVDASADTPTWANESPCSGGSVAGDPHYKTLDGLRFNFQGSCSYIMSQYTGTKLTPYKIVVKMWQFDEQPTYPRNMHVTFGPHSVYLFQQNFIKVNDGDTIQPPYYHPDFSITWNGNNSVLETDFGLRVEWSGRYKSILNIPRQYAGKISGLLGNYDGKKDNDLVKPDGTTGTVCEVGESWQEPDAYCKSTCDVETLHFKKKSGTGSINKFLNPFQKMFGKLFN